MKKLFIIFGLLLTTFLLTACGDISKALIKNNLSEVTHAYYFAENENFSISMSVGRREEPYMLDGLSQKKVDFSLLIFKDKRHMLSQNSIVCHILQGNDNVEISLQYNPLNNSYMYDLGYKADEEISFEFEKQVLKLEKLNFETDYKRAIDISAQELEQVLLDYKNSGRLKGECYLKILGENDNLYWCFTFLGQDGKSINLILSTKDGKIVAKD